MPIRSVRSRHKGFFLRLCEMMRFTLGPRKLSAFHVVVQAVNYEII